MHLYKKIAISYSLAACVLAGSIAFTASAATSTGASTLSSASEKVDNGSYSTFAGVNLTLNNILVNATEIADATTVEENEATAVAESEYTNIAIAQVDNYVYIRSEASAESEYVGKLYNNSAATVSETVEAEDGTWLCITSGDCTGYVKSEFVVQGDEELAKKVSRRLATCNTETLFVREGASTDTSVIDMIPLGDDLTVIDESMLDTGWVMVTCDGGEGYVSAEYVSLSTDYTVAESKAHEEARLAKEEAERKAAQEAAAKAAKKSKSASNGGGKSYAPAGGGTGGSVVSYASQFVGNPYVYGGSSLTNGTDCSGFVMSVYSAFGVSLPHSSSALRSCGYGVSLDAIQPGDIVCYSGHVAIYAGNGQIVHASNARTGITYSNVGYKSIICVRRIF